MKLESTAKRLLLAGGLAALCHAAAGSAMAADMNVPVYKAPPAPIAYNWTGCHVGIQGGGAWGTSRHTQDDFREVAGFGLPLTNNFNVTGAVIGGTLGCDYQVNNWVIGAENDLSWTNKKGSGNLIPPFTPAANTAETNEKWLDTLRLRVGVAWDRWFVYGTGGAAFSQIGVNICSPLAVTCGSGSHTVTGWTAGAGVEYAFWNNWSVKIAYLYVDLGTSFFPEFQSRAVAGGNSFYLARDVKLTNNIVRAGVNYKFGWFAPAMAKY
jgi:outer membrane immunogenic protein